MSNGNLYKVKRPDGAIVPLTCTEKQLVEIWIPAGYVVIENKKTKANK